jgi:hypothetical protein
MDYWAKPGASAPPPEEKAKNGIFQQVWAGLTGRRSKFQQVTGITLDSAVALRKVQGALRDNWSSATDSPIRLHQGALKRWSGARPTIQTLSLQMLALAAKAAQGALANHSGDEILGLDDIYTAPITGLFLDDKDALPTTPAGKMMYSAETGTPISGKHPHRAPRAHLSEIPVVLDAEVLELEPPPIKPVSQGGKAPYDGTFDANIRQQVQKRSKDMRDVQGRRSTGKTSRDAGRGNKALPLSAYEPPSGPSIPIEPSPKAPKPKPPLSPELRKPMPAKAQIPPAALTPSPRTADSYTALMSPEDEELVADWFGMTEGVAEPKYRSRYLRDENSSDMLMAGERRLEAAKKQYLAANQQRRISIGEQLQLDRELADDLSSMDYIARNNRILNESLTSLVDRYFQKSAMEDESSYY